jgi:lipopolysaccharide transport system ATP-binding protein
MSTAIQVDHLSKIYKLGSIGTGNLQQDLHRWVARMRGQEDPYLKIGQRNNREAGGTGDVVYSLSDISFAIEKGTSVGIIGRNGAGKSTLLKVLSRITSPSQGTVRVRGRVASLLEVGTGFHPELSGKENIYLNGSILGMRRKEIDHKLEEIIDFSGVGRYIDTPVKRYSSGMYVRLAFAVAAHLESEILIIDEVLAVGDAEFQKKCLGKMGQVSAEDGRTVLFVSHNMAAIKTLCQQAIVLEQGTLLFNGEVNEGVTKYLVGNQELINHKHFDDTTLNHEDIRVLSAGVRSKAKSFKDTMFEGEALEYVFTYDLTSPEASTYSFTFHLKNSMGNTMFSFTHTRDGMQLQRGMNEIICTFPEQFLNVGQYYLTIMVVKDRKKVIMEEKDVLSFVVSMIEGQLGAYMGREPGDLKPGFIWTNTPI